MVGLDCAEDVLRSLLEAFIDHEAFDCVSGFDGSFFDFRLKGLLALNGLFEKKPDFRFVKPLSGDIPGICTLPAGCLTGEVLPDIGSALVKEDGSE